VATAQIAIALATVAVSGCAVDGGNELGQGEYVRENVVVLRSIPGPPSGRLIEQVSRPYRESEQDGADIIGYWTIRRYATPRNLTPQEVIGFYRQRLATDWDIQQQSATPSLSYRKGDAYLHILPGDGNVIVEVDHDCYKGRPSPRCG